LKPTILALASRFEKDVIAMRRALHAMPEASFKEIKTQALLGGFLRRAGIEFRSGVAGTGVLALVRRAPGAAGRAGGGARGARAAGARGARTVALRADMDALNICEETGLAFASRNPGFMHACGHDTHMAMVLGAGMVLKALGSDLPGNVRLIFQPAEETPPGGALGMIRAGALSTPPVDAIIGVHVDPAVAAGKVGVNSGVISAVADDFNVRIKGRGGHGSSPHVGVDAIVVAAQFLTALQTVVSRRVSALDNVVVSVGRIAGGERHNIIAGLVEMDGTVRTKRPELRKRVPRMIKQVLDGTCAAFGAKGEFEYVKGYPEVNCDPELSEMVRGACQDLLGKARVVRTTGFEMGGEDFAYYAQKVPGTVILVGVTNTKTGRVHKLHQARFDLDEEVLKVGVSALAYSAYRYLEKGHIPFSDGGKMGCVPI
jgi:amidohydrolase